MEKPDYTGYPGTYYDYYMYGPEVEESYYTNPWKTKPGFFVVLFGLVPSFDIYLGLPKFLKSSDLTGLEEYQMWAEVGAGSI